jgi:hypothetical protein
LYLQEINAVPLEQRNEVINPSVSSHIFPLWIFLACKCAAQLPISHSIATQEASAIIIGTH